METWKTIPNTNDLYEISDLGRVKSLSREWKSGRGGGIVRIQDRYIKPHTHELGYIYVSVRYNKKTKLYFVHRLIAEAFIPNSLGKPNINHKNGAKWDNRIENLEWCTQSENVQHSFDNGFQIPSWLGKKGKNHHSSKPIKCIENNKMYSCAVDAAKELKINPCHISEVCKGKRKTVGGYKFNYA
jgi:hypothetical protein